MFNGSSFLIRLPRSLDVVVDLCQTINILETDSNRNGVVMKKSEVLTYIEDTTDFIPSYVYPGSVQVVGDDKDMVWVRSYDESMSLQQVISCMRVENMSTISFDNEGVSTVIILPDHLSDCDGEDE